jgi:hypothetical protein
MLNYLGRVIAVLGLIGSGPLSGQVVPPSGGGRHLLNNTALSTFSRSGFIKNEGQFQHPALYKLHVAGGCIWITRDSLVFDLTTFSSADKGRRYAFTQRFSRASMSSTVEAHKLYPGQHSYFRGTSDKWRTGVQAF